MKRKNNKTGGIAVFLLIIMLSLLMVISLFVNLSGIYAGKNIAEETFEAAGRSVLAEYNKELYLDYGIFGVSTYADQIERNLFIYANQSLQSKIGDKSLDPINLNIASINADLTSHSLLNINTFESEMSKQMKYRVAVSYFTELQKNAVSLRESSFTLSIIEASMDIFSAAKEVDKLGMEIVDISKSIIDYEKILISTSNLSGTSSIKSTLLLSRKLKSSYQKLILSLDGISVECTKFKSAVEKFNSFIQMNANEEKGVASQRIVDQIDRLIDIMNGFSKENLGKTSLKIESNIKTLNVVINKCNEAIKNAAKQENISVNITPYLLKYSSFEQILAFIIPNMDINSDVNKKKRISSEKSKISSRINLNVLKKGRVLKNEAIINSLPSTEYYKQDEFTVFNLENLNIFRENFKLSEVISKDILVSEYILVYLKNNQDKDRIKLDTFFNNEAEYILHGSFSDNQNLQYFKASFIGLRTSLNLIHIYSDSVKINQVRALALAISPTPWEALTEFLIASSWAAVEASNDLDIIENGGKVTLIKTNLDWKIDFTNFAKGKVIKGNKTENKFGLNYREYLRLFLLLENREKKIIRVMDIIQINMKGRYSEKFSIKESYNGFEAHAVILKNEVLPFYEVFGIKEFEIHQIQRY